MDALVLGGTRFVGLRLVWLLHQRGHRTTVLNRGLTEAALPDGVSRLKADRSDASAVAAALRGKRYDAVFDISGYTVSQVQPVLVALEGMVGHYVFCSTVAVYADSESTSVREDHPLRHSNPDGTYGKDKIRCEELLLETTNAKRIPTTIVRPPIVYGPHNHILEREASFFARLVRGRPVPVPGDGLTLTHQVHVDDLAEAMAAAAGKNRAAGQTYNVCGPKAISLMEYVETVGEVMGVTPEIARVQDSGVVEKGLYSFFFERPRSIVYSGEKISRELNWQPRYDMVKGLSMTYRWWLEQGLDKSDWDFEAEDGTLQRLGNTPDQEPARK